MLRMLQVYSAGGQLCCWGATDPLFQYKKGDLNICLTSKNTFELNLVEKKTFLGRINKEEIVCSG